MTALTKQITQRKEVAVYEYMLRYVHPDHRLFAICNEFQPGKFTVKAVNEKGTSETVIAVCRTKKLAMEVIEHDLKGSVFNEKEKTNNSRL